METTNDPTQLTEAEIAEWRTWARSPIGARQIQLAEGQKRRHEELATQTDPDEDSAVWPKHIEVYVEGQGHLVYWATS